MMPPIKDRTPTINVSLISIFKNLSAGKNNIAGRQINSLFYNIQKQCKEVHDQYYCIYSEKDNYLYLIFNTKFNYSEFTKDWLINILDFSVSVGIDSICLLVAKNNKMNLNIIQDMLIVGFEPMENVPKITIDGNVYKTLKMPIKDIYQEIKEIILV